MLDWMALPLILFLFFLGWLRYRRRRS